VSEYKGFAGLSEAALRQVFAYFYAQDSVGLASDGVLSGLSVSQDTTASASVLVSAGAGVVQDTVGNGAVPLVNNTQKTLDVLIANPVGGTPRNDIVVFDAATTDNPTGTGGLRVVVGIPNAVPTDPTVPATAIRLARIRNAASATTVPASAIDDLRTFTGLSRQDAGWVPLSTTGFPGTVVDPPKYRIINGVVYMQGNVQSFTSGTFVTLCTLPVGARPAVSSNFGVSSSTSGTMVITVATSGDVKLWCEATTIAYTGLANVIFPVG
jgi:hypothetical protein